MKTISPRLRRLEFENRIFISLSIVLVISLLSFLVFRGEITSIEIIGSWIGLPGIASIRYGYYLVALVVLLASIVRMWAGSILSSRTVMAFKIQNNHFEVSGPYNFVRNPIYFADLLAFTALSFCLRPIGLLIPILIYLHYTQLIRYEEEKLKNKFGKTYEEYISSTPSILPGFAQVKKMFKVPLNFEINFDGFRHNAQYVLFIPGLIVSAYTGNFLYAVLIGLPAVIDWAVIHTIIGLAPESKTNDHTVPKRKKFSGSKVFRDLLYAQCWEYPEMDRIAFKIEPGDTVFSITSGGCNAISFLIDDPGKVICLDMNTYQNYLLSLKINAFKALSYNELLEFLGVTPCEERWELFGKLRPYLSEKEQLYWDNRKKDIDRGIIHCGRYERYMHLLKKVFDVLIGKKVINEVFSSQNAEQRTQLFDKKWDNFRWRLLCRIFLSRTFASLFFDKAFYKYLDQGFSFDQYYRSVVKKAVTVLPVRENYFLAYILLGNYFENNYPAYLRKENYEIIKSRINRIEFNTSGCLDFFKSLASDAITKFNFTNIFEWMSMEEFALLLRETIRVAKNGAIITYRNHLVTRNRPESLSAQLYPDRTLSNELHAMDLSFIYKAYVIEKVIKN
jgi:S-adenosylmethionine-diacylglycerol 3-amino-3-carboxypropyl transferase